MSFYDATPKLKLATFDSMPVSSVKIGGKEVMLKADRDLFALLIVVDQKREMDLREVFKYFLGHCSSVVSGFSGWVSLQD